MLLPEGWAGSGARSSRCATSCWSPGRRAARSRPPAAWSLWPGRTAQRVAGLQVQADAVVEGELLADGEGNVARPGGPQQLLVLQPHAVVQPHSVRLHFRHGHTSGGCEGNDLSQL